MTEWRYAGYVKVHSPDRRKMIEYWDWQCDKCGFTVRKYYGNLNMPKEDCPKCSESRKEESE
jgi:rubrerythrin